ncbi:MAG: phosphoribosylamine-glycine ligase [Lasallia pustulata]|uniref:phosphoribosylformylglycinamidine cyclo-ligase n=1 Tax=Lasallia pustulata TaxID=136370 RepID=A0A5M8PWN0_9LECA|nr:MAG: phosphoribosylamine-glycine ligase [Lasallia pustulata]
MTPGDVLLALASSGLHSNGFSLVRKILERHRLGYHDPAPWDRQSVGDSLLAPTRIYVRSLLPLVAADRIKGMAHITGGGLVENIPRMLPARLAAEVDVGTWEMPGVFRWLMEKGPLEVGEVARAFNVGVGMVVVVGRGEVERVLAGLRESGERVWEVGRLVERAPQGGVRVEGVGGLGGR